MTRRQTIEAVVPVRGLPAGKSRLAAVLAPEERNRLVRAMLEDVVATLRRCPAITRVTVLSRDAAAAREAQRLGADFLQQPPTADGLNAALQFAQEARAQAGALLIVPADLPLITPADVDQVIRALAPPPSVALAPSYDGGTNALLLSPPSVIAPAFGPHSADRHAVAAKAAGATVAVVRGAHWALDLDSPEDIARLLAQNGGPAAGQSLETLRYLRGWTESPRDRA